MQPRDIEERLVYDRATGDFTWRTGPCRGKIAGTIQHNGYRAINLGRKLRLAHRLVWLCEYGAWPNGNIDHVNGVKTDNRIENLRLATKSQNAANAKRYATNECGLKGVKLLPAKTPTWMARIAVNGKRLYLGRFSSAEAAHEAYVTAAREHHGEFARAR